MKKSTWIVLGLVVVLGLIYKLTREEKVSVGVMRLTLPVFSGKDVDHIEITGKDKIKLKKVGDSWKIDSGDEKSPHLLAADQANVEGVIEAASSVRHSYYVTQKPEKLSELGLTEKDATIVKLFAGDKMVWALELGADAASSGRYAKLLDDPNVYVVKGSLWQLTRNGMADFRDKNILKIDEADLVSFHVKRNGHLHMALKRDITSGNWQFDESQIKLPKNFRANGDSLASLVRSSTNLQAIGFIDEKKDLPDAKLVIEASSKDGKIHSLAFFADGDKGYLVKKADDEQIFEVAKFNVERFNKDISEFRDLSVMKFDKNAIVSLMLNSEKGAVELKKLEGKWQIKKPAKLPDGFEFDEATVDTTLSNIAHLNAQRLADKLRDVPKNVTWLKIAVLELVDDKGASIKLFAGKTKSAQDEYLAKGNADEELYIVKGQDLSFLSEGVATFKKEELPPIDENTKGLESLPPDIRQKLLEMSRKKAK